MVNTRSSTSQSQEDAPNVETLAQQLSAIASKLNTIDSLAADVASLKVQTSHIQQEETSYQTRNRGKSANVCQEEEEDTDNTGWPRNPPRRPYTKMDFPRFKGGNPRGWILKAEKYFCYYQTPDEHKVDIAAMYLEGDALDLFSWINRERTLLYWEELVKALQENYGPAEFQNPDEHLCSIRQTGSIQEYRQEFAKRSSRVTDWPDHCLLGVFMNGLKEELKSDVRIHKPRTVYKAMSLAMEFEQKVSSNRGHKSQWSNLSRSNTIQTGSARDVPYQSVGNQHVSRTNSNSAQMSPRPSPNRAWEIEKQNRIAKGLCFRCNEKFAPGHRCKTASLTLMEANDNIEGGESGEQMSSAIIDGDAGTNDLAEISFHAFLGNTTSTTMKLQGTLNRMNIMNLQVISSILQSFRCLEIFYNDLRSFMTC